MRNDAERVRMVLQLSSVIIRVLHCRARAVAVVTRRPLRRRWRCGTYDVATPADIRRRGNEHRSLSNDTRDLI